MIHEKPWQPWSRQVLGCVRNKNPFKKDRDVERNLGIGPIYGPIYMWHVHSGTPRQTVAMTSKVPACGHVFLFSSHWFQTFLDILYLGTHDIIPFDGPSWRRFLWEVAPSFPRCKECTLHVLDTFAVTWREEVLGDPQPSPWLFTRSWYNHWMIWGTR